VGRGGSTTWLNCRDPLIILYSTRQAINMSSLKNEKHTPSFGLFKCPRPSVRAGPCSLSLVFVVDANSVVFEVALKATSTQATSLLACSF